VFIFLSRVSKFNFLGCCLGSRVFREFSFLGGSPSGCTVCFISRFAGGFQGFFEFYESKTLITLRSIMKMDGESSLWFVAVEEVLAVGRVQCKSGRWQRCFRSLVVVRALDG